MNERKEENTALHSRKKEAKGTTMFNKFLFHFLLNNTEMSVLIACI